MALLPQTREVLARYDAWIADMVQAPGRLAFRAGRLARHAAWRLRNMVFGMIGVVFLAFLYGNLVAPIGFLGLLLMLFAMLAVALLLAGWPPRRQPVRPPLDGVPLAALPSQLGGWLLDMRPGMPAAVAVRLDRLRDRLLDLAPGFRRLDPETLAAEDARRLLVGHLPRLVESYRLLPARVRASDSAQAHVLEGLQVVQGELERLEDAIAAERLRALETEGRFLGSRYGRPPAGDAR